MEIDVTEMQGRVPVTVIRITGSIDTDSHRQLQTRIQQTFEAGARDILLDLTEVPHISSSGLRVFVDTLNLMRGSAVGSRGSARRAMPDADAFKSPHFKLLNPSEQVTRVMTMTGLNVFLETYSELDEAIASF